MLPFSKILVLGKNGQLASSFRFYDLKNEMIFLGQDDLNVLDFNELRSQLDQLSPELIINCMAYTKVDQAEAETDLCRKLNTDFPYELGKWCQKNQKKLIHFSTDYVFDGKKETAYLETDQKNPLNVYGKTKSDGEDLLMSLTAQIIIFRISWVYSPYGNNFLKTMLKLGQEREVLKIVSDQIGAPCSALDVAKQILGWIQGDGFRQFKKGIYHLTPQGLKISWCEFAQEIFAAVRVRNQLLKIKEILPIKTEDYPTAAQRPKNSVMDSGKASQNLGLKMSDFSIALNEVLNVMTK